MTRREVISMTSRVCGCKKGFVDRQRTEIPRFRAHLCNGGVLCRLFAVNYGIAAATVLLILEHDSCLSAVARGFSDCTNVLGVSKHAQTVRFIFQRPS